MNIQKKIVEIVSDVIGCNGNELNDLSGLLTQYNWDSLNHISIITEIELAFGISIPDDLIIELNNIQKLAKYVEEVTK